MSVFSFPIAMPTLFLNAQDHPSNDHRTQLFSNKSCALDARVSFKRLPHFAGIAYYFQDNNQKRTGLLPNGDTS